MDPMVKMPTFKKHNSENMKVVIPGPPGLVCITMTHSIFNFNFLFFKCIMCCLPQHKN